MVNWIFYFIEDVHVSMLFKKNFNYIRLFYKWGVLEFFHNYFMKRV